jgi:hypothetical protein
MIKTTQIKTEVMRVERKYHEIDDSVKIDFEVPKILQSLIDEAEEADLADNFGSYENIADTIDVYCKNFYLDRKLTKEQWNIIMSRYKL